MLARRFSCSRLTLSPMNAHEPSSAVLLLALDGEPQRGRHELQHGRAGLRGCEVSTDEEARQSAVTIWTCNGRGHRAGFSVVWDSAHMLACALHEGFVDPTGDRKSSACKLNWMTYTAWTSPLHLYYTSPNTLHIVSSVAVLIRLGQPSWRRVLVEAGAGIRSRRRGTICHHAGAGGCVLELDGGECKCAREHNVPSPPLLCCS